MGILSFTIFITLTGCTNNPELNQINNQNRPTVQKEISGNNQTNKSINISTDTNKALITPASPPDTPLFSPFTKGALENGE